MVSRPGPRPRLPALGSCSGRTMAGLRVRVLLGPAVRAGWAGDGLRARAAGFPCWAPPRRSVLPGSDARTLCSAPGDLRGRQDPGRVPQTQQSSSAEEKKPSKSQQLKKLFQEYGAVGVSLHIGVSLASLGMFYTVVSSGVDMSALLLRLGFQESLVQSKLASGTSTFVVAYAIHKLFAPVRISITLVSAPLLVRYLRKVGFFKPPAAKP